MSLEAIVEVYDEPSHYTTGDIINGCIHVTPTARKDGKVVDVPFSKIYVDFEGISRNTWVQPGSGPHTSDQRVTAHHRFVVIENPDLSPQYPHDNTFKAGQKYDFPFKFRIPEELADTACQTGVPNQKVKDLHRRLVPSLGNPKDAGMGVFLKSQPDMASPFCWIYYQVYVHILKTDPGPRKVIDLARATRQVPVIPALDPEPPMLVEEKDTEYRTRHDIKYSGFNVNGRVAMEALEPEPFVLPQPSMDKSKTEEVRTDLTVMLRFDPVSKNTRPPRLGRLKCQLKTMNFTASLPQKELPNRAQAADDPYKLTVWDEKLNLFDRMVDDLRWEHHAPGTTGEEVVAKHQAAAEVPRTFCPAPTEAFKPGRPFYTARLTLPLTLPTEKKWVPTFHSCITSRVYKIHLNLGTPWCIALAPKLWIPIQIASPRSTAQRPIAVDDPCRNWLERPVQGELPQVLAGRRWTTPLESEATVAEEQLPAYEARVRGEEEEAARNNENTDPAHADHPRAQSVPMTASGPASPLARVSSAPLVAAHDGQSDDLPPAYEERGFASSARLGVAY